MHARAGPHEQPSISSFLGEGRRERHTHTEREKERDRRRGGAPAGRRELGPRGGPRQDARLYASSYHAACPHSFPRSGNPYPPRPRALYTKQTTLRVYTENMSSSQQGRRRGLRRGVSRGPVRLVETLNGCRSQLGPSSHIALHTAVASVTGVQRCRQWVRVR